MRSHRLAPQPTDRLDDTGYDARMRDTDVPLIGGWREALVSVEDIDAWVAAYAALGSWEVRHRGPLDAATAAFLNLPDGTPGEEALVAEPGSSSGFTRLVRFDTPAPTPAIRANARPWDTGGWYDLNVRVDDMDARFAAVQELGWGAESEPVTWQFEAITVNEWLVRAPDGVVFALIQRIDPPLPPGEEPGPFSRHVNSTQFVTDIDAAREFYQRVLGFNELIAVTDDYYATQPGPNVLGLPDNLAAEQKWNISLHEAPGTAGSWVETISLPGCAGQDFSDQVRAPNRGIISLRFPVADIEQLARHLHTEAVTIVAGPTRLRLEPYGDVRMLTARGPHGALLDFFMPV